MAGTALLLTAGRVLAGPAGEVIDDGAVLVEGGTITAVGARAELEARAPAGVERVDRPGGTVLPGLIDAHVHLVFSPGVGLEQSVAGVDDATLLLRAAGSLRRLLDAGVTTARDLGDRGGVGLRVRDAVSDGLLDGPRLLASGPPLTPPGGHCWFLGGEVGPHADDLRRAVRERAASGVDVVKVMASGGQNTPGAAAMWERQFDGDQLAVIVDEATRHGLPVAAHAHGADSVADAARAGVTTVEHCTWLGGPGRYDFRGDVADAMAAGGVVASLGTTAGRFERLAELRGPDLARELLGRGRRMADHGVGLVVGTDAGLAPFADAGRAVASWGEWGFEAPEIVEIATTGAARVLGLDATTGRVAPGLAADLLLVDGDPLADLAALTRPELVLARGRVHRPSGPATGG